MAQVVVVLFDVTRPDSFDSVARWHQSIVSMAQRLPELVLVGSKVDCDKKRAVSKRLAMQLAKRFKMHYQEVSAKSGKGLKELMAKITSYVLDKEKPAVTTTMAEERKSVVPPKGCAGCSII